MLKCDLDGIMAFQISNDPIDHLRNGVRDLAKYGSECVYCQLVIILHSSVSLRGGEAILVHILLANNFHLVSESRSTLLSDFSSIRSAQSVFDYLHLDFFVVQIGVQMLHRRNHGLQFLT